MLDRDYGMNMVNIAGHFERCFMEDSCKDFISLVNEFPQRMALKGMHCQIMRQYKTIQDFDSFDILVVKPGNTNGDIYQLINNGVTVTAKFVSKTHVEWGHDPH